MNENLYIAHKNLPHKTLRVHSARYTQCIHVSSRKLKLPKDMHSYPPTPFQRKRTESHLLFTSTKPPPPYQHKATASLPAQSHLLVTSAKPTDPGDTRPSSEPGSSLALRHCLPSPPLSPSLSTPHWALGYRGRRNSSPG